MKQITQKSVASSHKHVCLLTSLWVCLLVSAVGWVVTQLMAGGFAHIFECHLVVGQSRLASSGTAELCSVWAPVLQQASLGLFTWW